MFADLVSISFTIVLRSEFGFVKLESNIGLAGVWANVLYCVYGFGKEAGETIVRKYIAVSGAKVAEECV